MGLIDQVKFDDKGLVTAIAQDAGTGEVLMVAYMNRGTLAETLETGTMVYFSRSRQKRWMKGETSGHTQAVREAYIDCDGDALLFKIDQTGGACHKGYISCFFRKRDGDEWQTVGARIPD
ncbi:MAG: phosphoribosyl-AMP cyclohydrolase [Chitinivibrionales bacterium]|nr:phosphoribosyl-AMP cyclohydrolase [Chitinivibrionales bacterium]MBD3396349.1 phosphoribosyl-AMP cyclohydrolase [Chitinivibrionales bacterium]